MRAFILTAGLLVALTTPALASPCDATGPSGKARTNVQVAHCVNRVDARTLKDHPDLAKFLATRRLEISKGVDQGRYSREDGQARIQATVVEVTTELHKRAAHASQPIVIQQAPAKTMTFCNTLGFSTVCY